jgi:hypothetical protein
MSTRDLRLAMVQQQNVGNRAKDAIADKVNKICPAHWDPRVMNKILLTDVSEIPDKWKSYPVAVQRVYLASYNANINRWNNVAWAMKTASKAANMKWKQIQEERSRIAKPDAFDHDRYRVHPGGRIMVSFAGSGV